MTYFNHSDKYGRELGNYSYSGRRPYNRPEDLANRSRERRSDMRAAIAVAMSRHAITPEEIDDIMNEAYELNMKCKAEGTCVYSVMQQETGLNKI